ncbi:hypothetical protein [Actinokineospora xionganensis]|uniref:Sigma-70 family RNA polymerase sigma factor n=1 Tax=Actinokineospora xionganensis TaxID=2684470 RepID=A0ABR7LFB9_9PSEU|nr:hypothetical protein [Actinokineospora xionganensis]MBC6451340.1 hypothetical protein [Actinokineospora xionganensis]
MSSQTWGRDHFGPSPLDVVDGAFRLLSAGPDALAIDGRTVSPELPQRRVTMMELRGLIVRRQLRRTGQDAVWRELISRSRARDGQVWTLAAVGLALPGLRNIAGTLAAGYRGDSADLDAEILAGFLDALRLRVNPTWTYLAYRLIRAGFEAGRALRSQEEDYTGQIHAGLEFLVESAAPPAPWGHPDFVLVDAIGKHVISRAQAELIGRTRLENVRLGEVARQMGISYTAARLRRKRAERRLAAAILAGDVGMPMNGFRG